MLCYYFIDVDSNYQPIILFIHVNLYIYGGYMKITIESDVIQGATFTIDDDLLQSSNDDFINFLEDVKMLLQLHIDDARSIE
jgi:hypothetical protein